MSTKVVEIFGNILKKKKRLASGANLMISRSARGVLSTRGGGVGAAAACAGFAVRLPPGPGVAWGAEHEQNIAAALDRPRQIVEGWLANPGHCANLMNPQFTEAGAAYAVDPQSDAGIHWVAFFGAQ